MSANWGTRPLAITGWSSTRQLTPSELVARNTAGVVHVPGVLPLYTAQNSSRLGIHCTSMCQAEYPGSARLTVAGAAQWMPSVERRSSTVVAAAPQPTVPASTDHIHQSSG